MSVDNRISVTHPSLFVNYARRGSVIRDPAGAVVALFQSGSEDEKQLKPNLISDGNLANR